MITSELSWKLKDYLAAGQEPPEVCVANPDLSEGEMMTADEVEEFIKDSVATLRILADKKSPRYAAVYESYQADLNYFVQIGMLEEDLRDELVAESNTRF